MKRLPVSAGEVVKFDWVDSSASNGWQRPTTAHLTLLKITTLGYVIGSSDESISVTTSIANDGQVIDALSVPWGCISKLIVLPDEWEFAA